MRCPCPHADHSCRICRCCLSARPRCPERLPRSPGPGCRRSSTDPMALPAAVLAQRQERSRRPTSHRQLVRVSSRDDPEKALSGTIVCRGAARHAGGRTPGAEAPLAASAGKRARAQSTTEDARAHSGATMGRRLLPDFSWKRCAGSAGRSDSGAIRQAAFRYRRSALPAWSLAGIA